MKRFTVIMVVLVAGAIAGSPLNLGRKRTKTGVSSTSGHAIGRTAAPVTVANPNLVDDSTVDATASTTTTAIQPVLTTTQESDEALMPHPQPTYSDADAAAEAIYRLTNYRGSIPFERLRGKRTLAKAFQADAKLCRRSCTESDRSVYFLDFVRHEFARQLTDLNVVRLNFLRLTHYYGHLFRKQQLLNEESEAALAGWSDRHGGLLAYLRRPKPKPTAGDPQVLQFVHEAARTIGDTPGGDRSARVRHLAELILCGFADVGTPAIRRLMAECQVERCEDDATVARHLWKVANFVEAPLDLQFSDGAIQTFLKRHELRQSRAYLPAEVTRAVEILIRRPIGAENRARVTLLLALYHTKFFGQNNHSLAVAETSTSTAPPPPALASSNNDGHFTVADTLAIFEAIARAADLGEWADTQPEFAALDEADRIRVQSLASHAIKVLRAVDVTPEKLRAALAELACICAERTLPRRGVAARPLVEKLGVGSCRSADERTEWLWNNASLGAVPSAGQLKREVVADGQPANDVPIRLEDLLTGVNADQDRELYEILLSRHFYEPINEVNFVRVLFMMLAVEYGEYFGANNSRTDEFLTAVQAEIAAELPRFGRNRRGLFRATNDQPKRKLTILARNQTYSNEFTRAMRRWRGDGADQLSVRRNAQLLVERFATVAGDVRVDGAASPYWPIFGRLVDGLVRRAAPRPSLMVRIRSYSPIHIHAKPSSASGGAQRANSTKRPNTVARRPSGVTKTTKP